MPEPLVSTDIPPGDYAIPGSDQVLVIEGRAYWRPPVAPRPLVTPPPTVPAASGPSVPSWLKGLLVALASIAGGYFLGPAVADKVVPPAPPPAPAVQTQSQTQSHSPSLPNYRPAGPPPGVEPDGSFPVAPSPQLPR